MKRTKSQFLIINLKVGDELVITIRLLLVTVLPHLKMEL